MLSDRVWYELRGLTKPRKRTAGFKLDGMMFNKNVGSFSLWELQDKISGLAI